MNYLYILTFALVFAAIVGLGFKAFGLDNENKINKIFHLED